MVAVERKTEPAAWSGVKRMERLGGLAAVSTENWWYWWVVIGFKEKAF